MLNNVAQQYYELSDAQQNSKLSILYVEYCLQLLKFLYILSKWGGGLRMKIGSFGLPGFILSIPFIQNNKTSLPGFVKTIDVTLWSKTNSLRAQKFDLVLISKHTVSYENIF
jgi:hypothetical protein